MRQLTPSETLSLSKLIQMETNALAVSKASLNLVADEQLKSFVQSGISMTETRIQALQQFVTENNIQATEGVQ